MARIELYTTNYCPYCFRAKALLERKGVPFEEIDVTDAPDKRLWLRERTGRRTVPQIIVNGKPLGGYDDIAALDRAGRLDPLLAEEA